MARAPYWRAGKRAVVLCARYDNGARVEQPVALTAPQRVHGRRFAALDLRSPLPWLVGIVVVGVGLRLPSFGDSLFGDEVGAYWIVTGHGLGRLIYLMSGHSPELNPPLWFILAWFSEKVFGTSTESLKLVSLLSGTATIPLTYLLGRWTVGARAGLAGASLAALSPFLIFYSTEARPYALLVLLCLLSSLSLLAALRGSSRWWWAAYAATSCAVAYTHFTGVFLLAGQLLWALVAYPRARRALFAANAAAAVGFLPWLPQLIKTAGSRGTKIYGRLDPFGLHAMRIDLGRLAIGHPYLSITHVPGTLAAALILAGVALALAAGYVRVMRAGGLRLSRTAVLVVVLACSPPAGAALYSALHESVWGARNVISCWPGFAVLLGALLTYPRLPWRAAPLALVMVGFALGALKLSQTQNQRPDYNSAAAYIDRSGYPTAPVVDLAAPTPGPPTETEAALAIEQPGERHPVLRIGLPPLAAVLRAPPYTDLPRPSGLQIAREAAALAGDGELFIVAATTAPISSLESVRRLHVRTGSGNLINFWQFLGALPARFHPVSKRTFDGFLPVSVYLYRG